MTAYVIPRGPGQRPALCGYVSHFSPFAITQPIDTKPPVFGNVPPDPLVAYATSTAGATVSFAPTAVDAVDGPVPVSCSSAPGAFPIGKTPVTCTATDSSHNTATVGFQVWVQYQAPGEGSFFLPPINPDGSSIFKGATIPVKFALTGASAGIGDLRARLFVDRVSSSVSGSDLEATFTSAADSGNLFRYDAAARQYIYNLSTKALSAGTLSLRVDLDDGVVHKVNVSLKATR